MGTHLGLEGNMLGTKEKRKINQGTYLINLIQIPFPEIKPNSNSVLGNRNQNQQLLTAQSG
jgi:hypothetical protein